MGSHVYRAIRMSYTRTPSRPPTAWMPQADRRAARPSQLRLTADDRRSTVVDQRRRNPEQPPIRRVLAIAVAVFLAGAALSVLAVTGRDPKTIDRTVPNANPTNTTLRWPQSNPKTKILIPETKPFSAASDVTDRFRFNDSFVEIRPGDSGAIELARHSSPAKGIVATLQNASNGTGLAVRVEDASNMWVLVPAPKFGAFSLVRVAGGKMVETYPLPLLGSGPGVAVGLINGPDRIQAVINGVVRLEVVTTDLAEYTTVGLATLGGEAGSWRAVAAWR